MSKKIIIPASLIVLVAALLAVATWNQGTWATVDRFNPLVAEEQSYGVLSPGQKQVTDLPVVDSDGKSRDYTLDFTAWGTEDPYVKISHKGAHVSTIDYPSVDDVPAAARTALTTGHGQ